MFLTMMNARIFRILLALIAILPAVSAQNITTSSGSGPAASRSYKFLPLTAVREGMRGTARTVFRGSEPEEFNVEILGVLPGGVGPKQDLIIGRISGGPADRTAVFAGMSGSPVYVDGKLIGAISYSFPFSKEPICGITPIEQMISIFEQKHPEGRKRPDGQAFSFSELVAAADGTNMPEVPAPGGLVTVSDQNSAIVAVAGQSFQRIATPVTFTGFSAETLKIFGPQLMRAGLLPVAAAGGAAPITPLKKANEQILQGGTSVSMQLTRGDYSLAAAGTVTLRDGEKIYAFGHPFLSLGTSDLPMSESSVVTVVPNINNSFKLAVPGSMVGSMTQDRATGVFGSLGRAPRMIPVTVSVRTSRGQVETLNYEVVKDEFLTPLLLNITVFNALLAQERGVGELQVDVSGEVRVKGQKPVTVERRFAGGNAAQMAASSVATPVAILLRGRFDELDIERIELNLASTDGSKTGVLDRLMVDRSRAAAGETIEIQAFARTQAGRIFVQRIPFKVPEGTSPGPLSIIVGDGFAVQQSSATQHFVPRDLSDLIGTLNRVRRPDRLYLQAARTTQGAIIGSSEMPNLPPSVIATLNNDRTVGGVKPAVTTVISETEVAPAAFIIGGQQMITIEVIR
jgi:hypothetical protein